MDVKAKIKSQFVRDLSVENPLEDFLQINLLQTEI